MVLQVARLEEADIGDFVDIQTAAFAPTTIGLMLNTGVNPPSRRQETIEKTTKAFHAPGIHHIKVTDTATGKIIAVSKWRLYPNGRTEDDLKEYTIPEPGPHSNVEAEKDFIGYLCESRKSYMGTKPYAFLQVLVVHPDHQRRGAGQLAMEWGCNETDKLGLPAFVESSEPAVALYARYGFNIVKETHFELAKYGIPGGIVATNTIMIREPRL